MGPTHIEAIGAVLGGYAYGPGSAVVHHSTLLASHSTTWIPMSLLAHRAISSSIDLAHSYMGLTLEIWNERYSATAAYSTLMEVVERMYPAVNNRDPPFLDLVYNILGTATNGGYLLLCPNGRNILRTVTRPRLMEGTVFSAVFRTSYLNIIPVKYTDAHCDSSGQHVIMWCGHTYWKRTGF